MNSVLLAKNRYTSIGFGQIDRHVEQQYRLFINRVKLKQKNYTNALIMFVNIFNTFITEKYPDEKYLWLIVNNNQTTNYDLLDAKDKIYNLAEELDRIEQRLSQLENNIGIGFGNPKNLMLVNNAYISGTNFLSSFTSINAFSNALYNKNIDNESRLLYLPDRMTAMRFNYVDQELFSTMRSTMDIYLSI